MGEENSKNIPHNEFYGKVEESKALYLISFHQLDRAFENRSI